MSERTLIHAGRLIDVDREEVVRDRVIVVEGDRIADVVAEAPAETSSATIDLSDHTVLPGLMDMHAHMVGEIETGHGYAALVMRTPAQEAMTGVRNARATRRWPASPPSATSARSARSWTSRSATRSTRADARPPDDVRRRLRDRLGRRRRHHRPRARCRRRGAERPAVRCGELARTRSASVVREILHGGADFIKVIATGAVLTEGTNPGAPEFTEDEIRAAVEEAALYGTHVAAHAHGAEGIKRAVRAGVRSIEHGSLMDDEAIDLMVERGTYLVADIYNGDWIDEEGTRAGWSADVDAEEPETTDAQREGFEKARQGRREDRVRDRQRRLPARMTPGGSSRTWFGTG